MNIDALAKTERYSHRRAVKQCIDRVAWRAGIQHASNATIISNPATPPNVTGSGRTDLEQEVFDRSSHAKGAGQPGRHSECRQAQALPYDEPEQILTSGTHRDPDSELPGPLRDCEVNDGVDADGGKQESSERERGHQPRLKPPLGGEISEHLFNRLHLQYDRARIGRRDRFANGRTERCRIPVRLDGDIHGWLGAGEEELRHGASLQPVPVHVGDDANDGDPSGFRVGAPFLEPPANRVLACKEPIRERLVDDRDRPVLFLSREEPALERRNAERLEKAQA